MTDQPRCSGVRCGGPDHDWRDVPCPVPATTTFDGQPCCEDHRASFEANAHERFAEEGFLAGVALDRLRALQASGGLAGLLAKLDALEATNATMREDASAMLDALETQGQGKFIADMRAKYGSDDGDEEVTWGDAL